MYGVTLDTRRNTVGPDNMFYTNLYTFNINKSFSDEIANADCVMEMSQAPRPH